MGTVRQMFTNLSVSGNVICFTGGSMQDETRTIRVASKVGCNFKSTAFANHTRRNQSLKMTQPIRHTGSARGNKFKVNGGNGTMRPIYDTRYSTYNESKPNIKSINQMFLASSFTKVGNSGSLTFSGYKLMRNFRTGDVVCNHFVIL